MNQATDVKDDNRKGGLFTRLSEKLGATRQALGRGVGELLLGRRELDDALLEELEALLLGADVGVETTLEIIDLLTERLSRKQLADAAAAYGLVRDHLLGLLEPCARPLNVSGDRHPFVIMVVGVNGVGKTTTIGKLAQRLKQEGHRVMLAAGDTFRAAAVEQLKLWGQRHQVPVIAQPTGADAASVAHDALEAARARDCDVLIVDTAGRQHTQTDLMQELKKIKRVIAKFDQRAPHEVMLVLDAGTGQNALSQLHHFDQAVGVTGITLTKLDGTAKGGILVAIARKGGHPIRFIGVGESAEDLRPFDAREFVDALFGQPGD